MTAARQRAALLRLGRTALRVGVLSAAGVLLAAGAAMGDALSNIGPAQQVSGGVFGEFPLGNYALDSHFSAISVGLFSGVDVSGVPPMIAFFLANAIWQLTAFLANSLITVFTWAFSLDLLTGSSATGGAGALGPVSAAMQTIYTSMFGAPWLVIAIVLAGVWAMWKALVQRRYTETAGALAVSVVYVLVALLIVTQPVRTIGAASRWTNDMSAAFLSLTDRGTLDSEQQAKQVDADQLSNTLVFDPWVVLEFGGIEHCTKTGTSNSVPVQPLPNTASQQLLAGTEVQVGDRTCVDDANKYASHFLRYPPASSDRNSEYDALEHGDTGKLPSSDPSKSSGSYQLGPADEPAADAMDKGGQYERLLLAVVVFAGELGAFLLLGALSAGVVLAQIVVLVLLVFAPVALVIAVLPGRGHAFFVRWLQRLIAFLVRKAIYSLVLAVLLAVSAALMHATASLGWLLSFVLEAAFFWTVFLYRRQLTGQLSTAVTGHDPRHGPTADLAALYFAQRLWRGARGLGGPLPPPPPPPPPGTSGSPRSDGGPGADEPGPTGPVSAPDQPQPPTSGEVVDAEAIDDRPALAANSVPQPDRDERPRTALPVAQPAATDAGDDPTVESRRQLAPSRPGTTKRPEGPQGGSGAGAPQRSAPAVENHRRRTRDVAVDELPAPLSASADADTYSASDGDRQPDPIGDQAPSLGEQLRADHQQLVDNEPVPAATGTSDELSGDWS